MKQLSKGYWLNIELAEKIQEEAVERARERGLDKDSRLKAKGTVKAERKKWFGIF